MKFFTLLLLLVALCRFEWAIERLTLGGGTILPCSIFSLLIFLSSSSSSQLFFSSFVIWTLFVLHIHVVFGDNLYSFDVLCFFVFVVLYHRMKSVWRRRPRCHEDFPNSKHNKSSSTRQWNRQPHTPLLTIQLFLLFYSLSLYLSRSLFISPCLETLFFAVEIFACTEFW